jgi:AraC-like DNA-binding protein
MSFWDFARSTASVRVMTLFGEERGVSAESLLAGTRLSVAQMTDPNIEIGAEQELTVVDNLLRALGNAPGLGLEVGQRYHFSTYGLWGYGLVSSATGLDAMALALRFLPLTYAFSTITFHQQDDLGVMHFGEPGAGVPEPASAFLIERDMAAAAALDAELVGPDFRLDRFTLRSRNPVPEKTLFGVRPTIGSRTNSLAFALDVFRRPLPLADPITAAMCEQMCAHLVERRKGQLRTGTLVRQYLNAAYASTPASLADFARLANTSERTLKRRLRDEGTSFRRLSADFRRQMAEVLLDDGRLSLADIADQLGFSDASSFSQAFKKWSGTAPSTFRRQSARRP